ncbi:CPBP family intramembrane glutamic endopeptidase [Haliangium ochraceum]|uniref:Abortive infection protein n=1 Tax=Haliangium ochraceum (strain DSM 14365 / JCM 11303 / SMP-2) TaxID=502025 RepID=D0LK03_HALO1|nr:CPBP family intramembrane glutamic endopeptidase [Haliangium ochraceum]ACY18510.1 Abortive infection protein [Haliangium ochraceum DSM 14365]
MHRDLKHALLAYAAVAAAVAVLVRIDIELAFVGHVGSALVAVLFLYAPVFMAWRRGEDLGDYGFHAAPVGRGVLLGLGPLLIIFPLFLGGYLAFYEIACAHPTLDALTVPGACAGWRRSSGPSLDWAGLPWLELLEFAAVQWIVVALPEELFFRGLLLELLERALPPRRRVLGGGVGWALVISALLFALIHLPKGGDPRVLATFFPGLLFGWMRSATGSILAPVLAHGASNVFLRVLDYLVLA